MFYISYISIIPFNINEPMKRACPLGSTRRFFVLITAICAALVVGQAALAAPSVVGLWRFDEGSGTNVNDSSGLGNNGFLEGENGNVPVWVTGQPVFGTALQFTNDGVDHSYVSIPGAPSLMIGMTETNAWTITAWAYESSDSTGGLVTDYGRLLCIDAGVAFYFDTGTTNDAEMYTWSVETPPWEIGWGIGSPVSPLLDQWEHWAIVYDGTYLTLYLNANQGPQGGVASNTVTSQLAYPGYAGAITIASQLGNPGNDNWNGMLADVAMFSGALTQTQIATVMSGDFSAFIGGAPGFVSSPQNQTETPGATATFSAVADGLPPFQYQWYLNGTNALSSASNPTATNATLVLTNLQFSQGGAYSIVVSNSLGGTTSQPATLLVYDPATTSLVGLWRFNEPGGSTALDSSGLGNNGTIIGQNGDVPVRVQGQPGFGSALSFNNDGSDHAYVSIPSNDSLMIGQTSSNAWTITAWAYEDSDGTGDFVATYGRILVIDDGTALQLESGASGDGEFYTWSRANVPFEIAWGGGSLAPLLDQWEHWAVVYDGTNLSLYRDGNTGPNGGFASQPANSPLGGYYLYQDAIILGAELDFDGSRTWNGKLDDVAVFNIALSQSQIQTVMNGDFSAFVPKPQLSLSSSQGNIALSWPAAQATFQLQSSTNLAPASWANVSATPVQSGATLTVTLPVGAGTQYYRLIGP
jgi:hypothetical protein